MSVLVPPGAQGGPPDVRGTLSGTARTSAWPLFPGRDESEDISHEFEILLQLGRGSYGAVYKARVKATGEFVAIKVIQLGEGDKIADIQKEISMLAECNHPNVVRYLGSWRDREKLWIVMEFCGGGSISDLLQAGGNQPLEEEAIAYVCRETLAGLAYLHSIGKVHRDIKAGNILVTEAGAVKVADFGVAAQLTRTVSKRNTFIGTPHWMAPEVIRESRYDGKVDVWALGVTAIEMAECQPPRWRVNPMRVIFMISREPPPQLADLDRWSLPFHDFVAQSLQKDAKARPSAKFLQQHKFVAAARRAAAQQLLPRIKASVEMLAAVAEDSAHLLPAPLAEAQELTGRFSWRPPPEGATLPARAPWAKTGMARARLAGLSFGAPSPLQPGSRDAGATAERPPASGTVVIGGSASGSGRLAADAGGTVVVADGEAAGGDYLAALRAHARDAGGYAAAVSGAAAARETARLAAELPASLAFQPPKTERERIMERLGSVYEGGCVVPIPFLRAADAVPQALLDDLRAPYLPPGAYAPPLGQGTRAPLAPGDWQRAVAELVAEGAAPPRSRAPAVQAQATPVAQAVMEQVAASPCLLNLCRTLAFHKRTAAEEPLSAEQAEAQQHLVHDLSDTLRTILCL